MKIKYLLLLVSLLLGSSSFSQNDSYSAKTMDKARKIHNKVITIDTHDDISVHNFTGEINYTMNLD